ncbi:MAG: helix-turn-helix domain-containing protein [Candidatus Scalinduaceae bacterium]
MVFEFNFKKEDTPKLLKTKHVCQILQISTSFLKKLVKEEKIKSYKLDRLRRFSLEDILDYLTKNEEFKNSKV